jgi:cellulose synthase/poly-beta-1,6-N-acetylglucosamine synthase-like glycosyltransferase
MNDDLTFVLVGAGITLLLLLTALSIERRTWQNSLAIKRNEWDKWNQSGRFFLAMLVVAALWTLSFLVLYNTAPANDVVWSVIYAVAQILYFIGFMVMLYFLTRPINWVPKINKTMDPEEMPLIIMAYPVLREDEDTMHTTMLALSRIDYPKDKYRVIAIPNSDDIITIESLKRLQSEFSFLEIMSVPPTTDASWDIVWQNWENNDKAYWFHKGKTRSVTALLPKKTRQLIYLLYNLGDNIGKDWVLSYIDADSLVPANHFKLAATGLKRYDVLQSTNVVGNLLDTWAVTFHALDHISWDNNLYPHMSANGKHPYYVLGKGLFYKADQLIEVGGFNPWITIEDPEVGMRLWTNGKRLGIIAEPLIEESPRTFIGGVVQRNRWICGFHQSLNSPLRDMGMKFWDRLKARLNYVPTALLLVNVIGLPTGAYALYRHIMGTGIFDLWLQILSVVNIVLVLIILLQLYITAWKRTGLVLKRLSQRIWYMVRINPVFLSLYYLMWSLPIINGFVMYLTDRGKVWARTQKFDADRHLVKPR